jgi:hypothetical protein
MLDGRTGMAYSLFENGKQKETAMATVKMPESVPCQFDKGGWSPCEKPSDNGWCTEHENTTCGSCGQHATRSCDAEMGGLCCGTALCNDCQHDLEGGKHVTKEVYAAQLAERRGFEKNGRESKRMLARRGVPIDVELPRHLAELLLTKPEGFTLQLCHHLKLKHGLMGYFPALLKGKGIEIIAISADRESIFRVWESLRPKDSELVSNVWMVNDRLGVGYRMIEDASERTQMLPHKIFSQTEIAELFAKDQHPFEWMPGLLGAGVSEDRFRQIIAQAQQAA